MSENLTICPDCGVEFETVAHEKELPLQGMRQVCPDCDHRVAVGIVNYPDAFEVVAPDHESNGYLVQRAGWGVETYTVDEIGEHHLAAIELATEAE